MVLISKGVLLFEIVIVRQNFNQGLKERGKENEKKLQTYKNSIWYFSIFSFRARD